MPAPLNIHMDQPGNMPQSIPGATPPSTTGLVAPQLPDIGSLNAAPAGIPPGLIAQLAQGGQGGPERTPVVSAVDGTPQFMPAQQNPANMKYEAITQQDGTVLLRMINADGTPGPVVQIVKVGNKGAKK